MTIRKVGVLGAGLMGAGIAEICAKAGYETRIREVTEDLAAKGIRRLESSLEKAVEKKKLTPEDRDAAKGRLRATTKLEDMADCDIVIEAIVENLEAKKETFRSLDAICAPTALFCSNTSSLTITEMSAATSRPDRFAGLHFFNPVPVMKLVEVVRTIATSEETIATVMEFARSLGKEPILANDNSGFIVNRLLVP
jgi:3-hydroxybutyryl-CoA dehydrogenase